MKEKKKHLCYQMRAYDVVICTSRWSKNNRLVCERNNSNYLQQFPYHCLVKVIVLAVM